MKLLGMMQNLQTVIVMKTDKVLMGGYHISL